MQFQRSDRPSHQNTLHCNDHQGEVITNYCSCLDCLKPLCPECQNNSIFDSLQACFNIIKCINKSILIQKQNHQKALLSIPKRKQRKQCSPFKRKQFQSKIKCSINIIINNLSEPQIYQQESQTILQKLRKQIVGLVDTYFNELDAKLSHSTNEIQKKFMQLSPAIDKMKAFQKDLDGINRSIETYDSNLFQNLQKVTLMEVEQLLERFKNDIIKSVSTMNFEQLVIRPDDISTRLTSLRSDIEKTIPIMTLRHSPYNFQHQPIKSTQKFNTSYAEPSYLNEYSRVQYDHHELNQSNHSPAQSIHDSFQASQTIKKQDNLQFSRQSNKISFEQSEQSDFTINVADYFNKNAPRKFLHFFQNDSINLFYLDLNRLSDQRQSRQQIEFELIEINNNFRVPTFHRSVSTPTGNLYLIGGTLSDGSGQKSGITYQFDFSTNSLTAISMMQNPRSSHGLVFHEGYIYSIGGYEQKHIMTARCERMNPKGRWESICSLNQVCSSMSICSFGKDYIFKFGGITLGYNGQTLSNYIERYDVNQNIWKVIEPQVNREGQYELLSTSASVQINQNDILVFGGYSEDNIGSNQSFLFSETGNEQVVHSINQKPLPYSEAFWNAQVIIHQGMLIAIQNVGGDSEDSCLEDERSILIFGGRAWKVME